MHLIASGEFGTHLFGIEVLDLRAGANSASATRADVLAITDAGQLRIDGDADDVFASTGQGWAVLGDVVLGSQVYHH